MDLRFKVTAGNLDYMIDILKSAKDEARHETDECGIHFDNVRDIWIDVQGGN
jgi:hypothetical protein